MLQSVKQHISGSHFPKGKYRQYMSDPDQIHLKSNQLQCDFPPMFNKHAFEKENGFTRSYAYK